MPAVPRPLTAASVRALIVRRTFAETARAGDAGLGEAVARMGFVQLDPIRAPARAQDLILRHRVAGYRAGDLERAYPALGLDEDVVYAYGVVSPAMRALLFPRAGAPKGLRAGLPAAVLAAVRERGPTHPRDLIAAFGVRAERNAWGGQSRATTRALEQLHYWGLVRVARRDAGIRVYEAVSPAVAASDASPDERLLGVALSIARLFGALPEASLRGLLQKARWAVPAAAERAMLVPRMVRAGALERGVVDGVAWVWPAGDAPEGDDDARDERVVRLLAPFDPLVWDRRRLEQLWEWPYRFEAYTPAARRQFGYYALPMLWGDDLIGWANVALRDGALVVEPGYARRRPRDREFTRALAEEVARMGAFLGVGRRKSTN